MNSRNYNGPQADLFAEAIARRDAGMAAAANNAGDDWGTRALGMLREYLARTPAPFLCEDVRAYADVRGFDKPPNPKAWGAVMTRAARLGIVKQEGFRLANSSNRSPKVLWGRR